MITMILLAAVFLAVVVPQALAARSDRESEFLASIRLHAGVPVSHDQAPQPERRRPRSTLARRRMVLGFLLAAVGVSAVAALVTPAKATLIVQLAVDNCFLAYVGQLVRWRDARTPAPASAPAADPVLTPTAVRPALRIG